MISVGWVFLWLGIMVIVGAIVLIVLDREDWL